MCYLMCLATPAPVKKIAANFDGQLALEPLSDTPIARAALGDTPAGRAYLATVNGCSCDLIRGGHHMEARPELVLEGLAKLLEVCPTVTLLAHWFNRPVEEVPVEAKREKSITLKQLRQAMTTLEEDVRYVVKK